MRTDTVVVLAYSLCFVTLLLMVFMLFWKFCRVTYDYEEFQEFEVDSLNAHGKRSNDRPNVGQEVNEETQV